MTEVLLQYALFLAEAVTVVAGIAALVLVAVTLSHRDGGQQTLEVSHINARFEELEHQMRHAITPKAQFKAELKARKKARKAQEKADKQAAKKAAKHTGEAAGEVAGPRQTDSPPEAEPGDAQHPPRLDRRRVYVLNFKGDIKASGVAALRAEVTALLMTARPEDEVLVCLDNAGGLVHEHGLAASQLLRLKQHGIRLTVAVDKVAASGGYMMACVADRIVAAPFAILGSIGVLLQLPNFHRLLDSAGVDFEQVKGGNHKRTLTLFGENSDADRAKAREDVEDTHELFKGFVAEHRPRLALDQVATGEHWYGVRAIELELCDALQTSDDFLLAASKDADIYELRYATPKPLGQRLAGMFESMWDTALARYAFVRRYGGLSM